MDVIETQPRLYSGATMPVVLPRVPAVTVHRTSTGRRWLGVLAFLVLTAISLPIHAVALFFVYIEFASPGDAQTATLLVVAAFVGSFLALLTTGTLSQLIGGFPGRWRARVSFAAFSAVLALGTTVIAALTLL
jgi:hypothetical protein